MSETPESIARQIAELESSLSQPLPDPIHRLVAQQLAALRQQHTALVTLNAAQTGDVRMGDVAGRDVRKGAEGTTDVSGTMYGAAVGVNLGTIMIASGSTVPPPASGAVSQASAEQIAVQRERLATHRATLATLLSQQAILGSANAPPAVAYGIREARTAIQRIKDALRGWGVAVEDGLDDV